MLNRLFHSLLITITLLFVMIAIGALFLYLIETLEVETIILLRSYSITMVFTLWLLVYAYMSTRDTY
ncbi:MAG: hypothetical protein ACOCRK_07985 [bacterium]